MKTLLAFNFSDKNSATNLAGFTLQCPPKGMQPYYLQNNLRFETPGNHAQDPKEPANSSINAPFHKFRWLHVPGSIHQGTQPVVGPYTYTVTPRYFDNKQSLQPIDPLLSVAVTVDVEPFQKQGLELGFTRGFTQSQAFDHHFGIKALIPPDDKDLIFDTSQVSGTNAVGEKYSFADEYEWLGFTAREKIFDLLNEVLSDNSLHLDMLSSRLWRIWFQLKSYGVSRSATSSSDVWMVRKGGTCSIVLLPSTACLTSMWECGWTRMVMEVSTAFLEPFTIFSRDCRACLAAVRMT